MIQYTLVDIFLSYISNFIQFSVFIPFLFLLHKIHLVEYVSSQKESDRWHLLKTVSNPLVISFKKTANVYEPFFDKKLNVFKKRVFFIKRPILGKNRPFF